MSRCIKSERCTASHPTYPHADRILKGEGDPRSPDASGKIRGDAVFPPPGRLPPPSATRVPFGEWGDRFPVMADVPRGLQDRPRGLQDGPMTAQEAPKTAPRGPQDGPRDPEGLLRASLPLKQKDSSAHTIRRCTILLIILYFSAFGDAMMRILLPHARSHRVWNFSLLHLEFVLCELRKASCIGRFKLYTNKALQFPAEKVCLPSWT